MPSVNSRSMPNVWPSSTFTTPSLPTFSIASAITSPISSSPAEIVATRAERHLDRVGDRVNAELERLARVLGKLQFFMSHQFSLGSTSDPGEHIRLAQNQ